MQSSPFIIMLYPTSASGMALQSTSESRIVALFILTIGTPLPQERGRMKQCSIVTQVV